jgi:myo-inositol-1(or 4)-monophosphatase
MQRIDLAKTMAKEAGEILLQWFDRENEVTMKSDTDVMLTADTEAEKYILGEIQKHFPGDAILSEEAGNVGKSSAVRWIVDPLDGTVNFAAKIPFFCTAIGIEENGIMTGAVVFDPFRKELFVAERGKGAFKNEKRISVSENSNLKKSIVSAMSRFRNEEEQSRGAKEFLNILHACRTIRVRGSTMIDMCLVASGSFDGFVKIFGAYEDVAVGTLIIQEAGGKVTDDLGKTWNQQTKHLVASNGILHEELLKALKA